VTDVVAETVIDRPRDAVAAYVTDWRNDPTWIRALRSVDGDGPATVGVRVTRVAAFLGRRIEYVNEIVELVPGERLAMRSVKAPFPMTVLYEFDHADGGGTHVRIRAGGDAGGFYRLAAPLLDRAVERGIHGDLARLKQILESRA
jgi:uncharacterized membrane protein